MERDDPRLAAPARRDEERGGAAGLLGLGLARQRDLERRLRREIGIELGEDEDPRAAPPAAPGDPDRRGALLADVELARRVDVDADALPRRRARPRRGTRSTPSTA
jgi:hypothetical protein